MNQNQDQDQQRLTQVDADEARRLISAWAVSLGLPAEGPYADGEVVRMLTAAEYAAVPGTPSECVRKGYCPGPPIPMAWTPAEVYALAAALESRRRWKATPSKHDPKKTGARLLIEKIRAEGCDTPCNDLDAHTVEDLVLRLVQCDSRAERECLYEVLRLKLEGFEE